MSRRGGRGSGQNRGQPPDLGAISSSKGRGRGGASSSSTRGTPPDLGPISSSKGRGVGGASSSSTHSRVEVSSPLSLASDVEKHLKLKDDEKTTPSSSKSLRFPARPGKGTLGRTCLVRANHFLVDLAWTKDLYHYDVAITPEVASRGVNRAVIGQLVDIYKESHLGRKLPAYDGKKSLYTAGALPFTSKEFKITLADSDRGRNGAPRRERQFTVTIKLAGQADLHHLQQFLQGRQSDLPQETLQVLDVVLRESPSHNYSPVGRSFFSPSLGEVTPIGDGLECWRGFYQSLRPTQMGLSLNIDISATSFFEPIHVIDFVANFLNRDPSRPLSDIDRVKVKKALKGVKVEVTHTSNESRRRYRVTGITSEQTHQLRFPIDDSGTQISVVQYFKEKYGFNLRYVSWPCLQVGSSNRPTYLPMEVCKIVQGQRYTKKLNERQVTAILRAACQRPRAREENIKEMVRRNNYNRDKYANEFGIKVNDGLASIEARVLPPPKLKYHDSGRERDCTPNVGQWNMINKKMFDGATVNYWTCLNFSRINPDGATRFCRELAEMCTNIGMRFHLNPVIPIRPARADRVEPVLKELQRQAAGRLELLIIILPETSGLYGKLKRICETEWGIVSQCCKPKHASRPHNNQYLENVALKINVKVGGRNTVLVDALSKRIRLVTDKDEPTIIFGADVTHPSPGEDSSPSIAAVVASQDWPEITKYCCLVSAQGHREEIIKDLFKVWDDPNKGRVNGGMIRELLMSFRRSTGRKPHRIIFYRDGVSEGQFSQVLLYELDAIRKACVSLEENYLPPVTFVVVQKRHHTRLFAVDPKSTDRSGNILPGTVVDTKICHPSEFDFYLCSHAGIQGTSRPTHYHVLWDENGFTADDLQTFTNNLCYTYARCTRSVSIVPPAYYAHLAAFRARYYLEDASDSGSLVSGTRGQAPVTVRPLPAIKENVKKVMFYC